MSPMSLAVQQLTSLSQTVAEKRARAGLRGYGSFGYGDFAQPTDQPTCLADGGTWDPTNGCSGAIDPSVSASSPTAVAAAAVATPSPAYSVALQALQASVANVGPPVYVANGARRLTQAQQAAFIGAVNGVGATVMTATNLTTGVSDQVSFENIPSSPTISASTWIGWKLAEGKAVVMTQDPSTATMGMVAAPPDAADKISAATSSTIVAMPPSMTPMTLVFVGLGAAAVGYFGWRAMSRGGR